jgi:hypothetical protein
MRDKEIPPLNRPLGELLADLSTALDPEVVSELFNDLTALTDVEVPGVVFEQRGETSERQGKISLAIGTSRLIVSSLQEIDWSTPLAIGHTVTIQASADCSGNRRPNLLVLEQQRVTGKPTGIVCSLTEPKVTSWLEHFLLDITEATKIGSTYWGTRPRPSNGSAIFNIISRSWVYTETPNHPGS